MKFWRLDSVGVLCVENYEETQVVVPFLGCLDYIFWEENRRLLGSGCFDAPPSSTLSLPGFCPVGGKTAAGKAWLNPEKSSCDVWIWIVLDQ